MANEVIKAGDVVELKSGSAKLTVAATGPDSTRVYWFNFQDNTIQLKDVPTRTLKIAEPFVPAVS